MIVSQVVVEAETNSFQVSIVQDTFFEFSCEIMTQSKTLEGKKVQCQLLLREREFLFPSLTFPNITRGRQIGEN